MRPSRHACPAGRRTARHKGCRSATPLPADLPAITAIYAHHVLHGTGTFEEEPPDEAEMAARIADVQGQAGPGWWPRTRRRRSSASPIFAQFRAALRLSLRRARTRVYVRDDIRGQGVGKALVAALLERAEAAGFRQIFAVIGDSDNVGSIGLHVSLGFRQVGVMRAAGVKFGRWLDVVFMQRAIGSGDRDLPQ